MDKIMKTDVQTSAIVPEIWSSRWYDVLLAELPFNSLISKDYEGEIKALGDTVNVHTMPEFDEATVLPEGEKNDADSLTIAQQKLLINLRVVKDFIVTNESMLQSLPFVEKLKEMAVYAIMKKVQALIIERIIPSTSPDHTLAYASGTTLALQDMLDVKELLDAQNVPLANRHFVMGSAQLNDIFNITGFTSSDFVAGVNPLQSGELPSQLLGFMPHMTTVVGNSFYAFHSSFMTMAFQEGMQVKEFDMGVDGVRAKRVNCDTLLGIKQLDEKRVATKA